MKAENCTTAPSIHSVVNPINNQQTHENLLNL